VLSMFGHSDSVQILPLVRELVCKFLKTNYAYSRIVSIATQRSQR
jgi:hypothetical protein